MSRISNSSSPFQSISNRLTHTSLSFPPNSRWTKQSFREECDINTIMARYQSTGEMPVLSERAPQYLDVSSGFDFAQMQDQVLEAQRLFNDLPSALRNRFENNPALFLDYVQDEANRPEMYQLGLLKKSPSESASAVSEATSAARQSAVSTPSSSSSS
ncbi:VP3 [Gokushovirus WZ-2015a]|nr:VP3 [Gokushovirus WZ-2015a]